MTQGIRIQKVLSDNGILSRRKAEEYVKQGKITVNGRPAKIGHPVNVRKDIIAIEGERVYFQKKIDRVYIMLHKPRGYVTTMQDEMGRRCTAQLCEDAPAKVYPVGRLDKDSEGLLLMTNDGNFANTVMHPSNHISKTYRVTVRPSVDDEKLIQLSTGVEIDGKMTLPAQVHVISQDPGRVVLQITITEGRNRQIRKMCEAVGLEVARLKRSSIGPLKLGMLKPGEWRELTPLELSAIRNSIKQDPSKQGNQDKRKQAVKDAAKRAAKNGTKKFAGKNPAGKKFGDKKFGDRKPRTIQD